ncbi:MAG: hypothetical protein IJX27_07165 [Clostridia bacterium]|nr:hypothetical protein [Clostridia bacterium]
MWESLLAIFIVGGIIAVTVEFIEYILPIAIVIVVISLVASVLKSKEAARKKELELIIAQYSPKKVSFRLNAREFPGGSQIHGEAQEFILQYKKQIAEDFSLMELADGNIEKMLYCEGTTTAEKLKYLNKNKYELERLKIESDKCHRKTESRKIRIICGEGGKTALISEAALAMLASKKCTSAAIAVKDFVADKKPADLALFVYEQDPAVFYANGFYFCVFENIILVFDENGVFSAALDASAFRVTVERRKTKSSFDRNIDTDSAPVVFDEQRAKWLYERRDGHRDMRYKDNQLIEYTVPVSGYEYGIISISLGSFSAVFSVSSSAALGLFERIGASPSARKSVDDIMCIEKTEQEGEEPASLPFCIETKNKR